MRSCYRFELVVVLIAVGCMGCQVELQHQLDELQANEILMLLKHSGIDAEKRRDPVDPEKWMISVPEEQTELALGLILDAGMPKNATGGFQDVNQKDNMLPTTIQERMRYVSALSGELQRTLEQDDQVIRARVHITFPFLEKSGRNSESLQGSASVFLKTIPAEKNQFSLSDDAVKSLVANGVGGMRKDDVTVVRTIGKQNVRSVAMNELSDQKDRVVRGSGTLKWLSAGLLFCGVVLILLAVIHVSRQRKDKIGL